MRMFHAGSAVIFAAALSGYFARLLASLGKKLFVVGSLALGDIIFMILSAVLLNVGRAGILSLVISGLCSCGAVCLSLGILTCRQLRLRIAWVRMSAVPFAAGAAAGLAGALLKGLFAPHLGNLATAALLLVISGAVYWGILLLTRNFREQELEFLTGGKFLSRLGQMLHLV